MVALVTNVSPSTDFDGTLDRFLTFQAQMMAYTDILKEVRDKFTIGT